MKTIGVLFLFLSSPSWAQTFVGTFVAVKGDVKILRSPAGNKDAGPFALYEGIKYTYEKAKIGNKIKPSEVVQSGADGKAKIAYPNGDHFIIGYGTTLILPAVSDRGGDDKKGSSMELIYGRVRSLISKGGPRNNMKVKTPSAVAGVRGTDFFARSNPAVGTQITVLRGEVAMQSATKPEETVSVKTGYTAEAAPKAEAPPKVEEATKEDLMTLQGESAVKVAKEDIAKLPPEIKGEVTALAEKTKEAVLDDIKTTDAQLYKNLAANGKLDAEDINTAVVADLYKAAPSDKKRKPTKEEIDSIGKDVYDKYFKNK